MAEPADQNATVLLVEARRGSSGAAAKLLPLVYDELRSLAAGLLRRERREHTLQPTALVHEVYLRLVDQSRVGSTERTQFLGLAAGAMRKVLIDHARRHGAAKRGGGWQKVTLDEDRAVP